MNRLSGTASRGYRDALSPKIHDREIFPQRHSAMVRARHDHGGRRLRERTIDAEDSSFAVGHVRCRREFLKTTTGIPVVGTQAVVVKQRGASSKRLPVVIIS